MAISATPLRVEWTNLWKDFQEVRPTPRLRVTRAEFENLDEVLKDDPLLLKGCLVQQLADVGPRLAELLCLLLQPRPRSLPLIEFRA